MTRRNAYDSGPLALCDWEIARAGAYQGPDGIGALMGQTDWMVEERMIREEKDMLYRGSIWVSRKTKARVHVLTVNNRVIEFRWFANSQLATLPREIFLKRFRPDKGKLA